MPETQERLVPGALPKANTIEDLFAGITLIDPTPSQAARVQRLRDSALFMAEVFMAVTPDHCSDQLVGLRYIRQAMWHGIAAISLEQKPAPAGEKTNG